MMKLTSRFTLQSMKETGKSFKLAQTSFSNSHTIISLFKGIHIIYFYNWIHDDFYLFANTPEHLPINIYFQFSSSKVAVLQGYVQTVAWLGALPLHNLQVFSRSPKKCFFFKSTFVSGRDSFSYNCWKCNDKCGSNCRRLKIYNEKHTVSAFVWL